MAVMRGGSGGHRHASHHKSKPPGIKLWGDHWVLAEERRRTAASLLQLHIWSVLHPLPCSCWQAVEETSGWRMWSSSPVRGSVEDCHTTAAEWADYVNPGQTSRLPRTSRHRTSVFVHIRPIVRASWFGVCLFALLCYFVCTRLCGPPAT